MRIGRNVFVQRSEWERRGYTLPKFDLDAVAERTRCEPRWIHFGAGNIFRSYQSMIVQTLLDKGVMHTGLIAAEGFDPEIVERVYRPAENICLVVTLKADGSVDKTLVASIVDSYVADPHLTADWDKLCGIFRAPSLQMVTFSITEKGYSLRNAAGELMPDVETDMQSGPQVPRSYMGKVAGLLHERYIRGGAAPIAMVSMDNCSHNGDRLLSAVSAFADEWERRGVCSQGFAVYVADADRVSFPWTMIDKITPRPNQKVRQILESDGVEDVEPFVTAKSTFIAPFVNAEECQYLVVEDCFPNGRSALEEAGVLMADRETVDKVERMKVCTCLNPLHTFLAVFGCLLGYRLICDEMCDHDLLRLVSRLGYDEGLPVVVDPGILSPRSFIDEVLKVRFPNPFMPDTPQRIACDTSQKLPIRFGETLKAYARSSDLITDDLRVVPLVFAGWLRYLMAVDDDGNSFELSPDPLLNDVCRYVSGITLGENSPADVESTLRPLLKRSEIFGVDLYEAGLAERVVDLFLSMTKGQGAVRDTLQRLSRTLNT